MESKRKLNRKYFLGILIIAAFISFCQVALLNISFKEQGLQAVNINKTKASAKASLSESIQNVYENDAGQFSLQVDTSGAPVDSVDLRLSYPNNLLKITSLDFNQTACATIPNQPEISTGDFAIHCTLNSNNNRGQILQIAKINYIALKKGFATIHFLPSSQINLQTKNILSGTLDGLVHIQ